MSNQHKQKVPFRLLAQILFTCFLAGTTLSLFGIEAVDIAVHLLKFFRSVKDMGWDNIELLFSTLLLGAIVVVPICSVFFLLKFISNRTENTSQKQL